MTEDEIKNKLHYTDRPSSKEDAEKKYYEIAQDVVPEANIAMKRKAFAAAGLALASVGFAAIANDTGLSRSAIQAIMDLLKVVNGIGITVSLSGIITALSAKRKALKYIRDYEKGNIEMDTEKELNNFLDRTEESLEKRGISR